MSIRRAIPPGGLGGSLWMSVLVSWAAVPLFPLVSGPGAALEAQETHRIWGRVQTAAGQVYEGFIRWDRNEASWADLLSGSKESSREAEELWMELTEGADSRRDRVIEVFDIRISWDDREFPGTVESGIRFGQLRRLEVVDDQTAELELKSGMVVELEGGSTDLGEDIREILVEVPGGRTAELRWLDLDEIQFGPAPPAARSAAERLYGTVLDESGYRHTGYISWDMDEVFTTDTLDGQEDGRDREIPFGLISVIENASGEARVTLHSGEEMVLSGSNDVDDGNRGIQVSDPALGMVHVPWDHFQSIRFHEAEAHVGYDAFDGGHRLRGTVVTQEDEEYSGWILWDADEEYSWEILDGVQQDGRGEVAYDVEFGMIASIETVFRQNTHVSAGVTEVTVNMDAFLGAEVTLLDGRVILLEGSNDVNDDNKGIFIQVDDQAGSLAGGWVLVPWKDLREIHFHH